MLGLNASLKMGLINPAKEVMINKIDIEDFPQIFEESEIEDIGSLKLEVRKGAVPVCESPRRFPVGVRKQIKQELQRLEKLNVIRKVEHPTEWTTNMVFVVTPKRNRVCIAPKKLNENLIRNRFITPIVEEITPMLSKAKIFSVLDAKNGFHGHPVAYASRTLTNCEKKYAQIEKETLAILFGVKRFEKYVFGKTIHIQSDHKPLEIIFKKSLCDAPKRIQRMLLQLVGFDIVVNFIKGVNVNIADAMSRLPATDMAEKDIIVAKIIEESDGLTETGISATTLHEIREHLNEEEVAVRLKWFIENGWPDQEKMLPALMKDWWKVREQLTVCDGIILKNQQVYIPDKMRGDILEKNHKGHQGLEACLRYARSRVFWIHMARDIKDTVHKCEICEELDVKRNQKETLQLRKVPEGPWMEVATDILEYDKHKYLVVVDYFSSFFEFKRLHNVSSHSTISALKHIFARYGVQVIYSDEGTNYSSKEFKLFAREWNFTLKTSSPHHHQSNGKAESAVKQVKRLLKLKEKGEDVEAALMLNKKMQRYKKTHDSSAKDLPSLRVGESVRVLLNPSGINDPIWKRGVVLKRLDSRSYLLEVDGRRYRRNRIHLKQRKTEIGSAKDEEAYEDWTLDENKPEQTEKRCIVEEVEQEEVEPEKKKKIQLEKRQQENTTEQSQQTSLERGMAYEEGHVSRFGRRINKPKKLDL
ncbi:unnamed protein product [Arctia plantaginis]|uniref:RNA-directed DNA polymerase n=1 Tax=Arctia plantaginis TaxID=874455 RepID=A0A8S0YQL1_ARCPL|nr:unnamed protein product [Arctia plantaginis]